MFEKVLLEAELFKGPYLEMNLPFYKGKSLSELQTPDSAVTSLADSSSESLSESPSDQVTDIPFFCFFRKVGHSALICPYPSHP